MIIDCISDLHGYYPNLEGGDLLIVAGDLTSSDTIQQHDKFFDWLSLQDYKKKIYIAGNHDNLIASGKYSTPKYCDAEYLCDSGTEFEYWDGLTQDPDPKVWLDSIYKDRKRKFKIWGSPWTKTFPGMNPHCKAFTVDTEEELAEKFSKIPDDIDILITHSPPYGILDECGNGHVGSASLLRRINEIKPKAVFYGHIHEFGLRYTTENDILFVNASYVDERYKARNGYVRCQVQNTLYTASVIQEQKR